MDIVLSPPDGTDDDVPNDPAPSSAKVRHDEKSGNYIIGDVTGLYLTLRWRLDNRGYEVATSELRDDFKRAPLTSSWSAQGTTRAKSHRHR